MKYRIYHFVPIVSFAGTPDSPIHHAPGGSKEKIYNNIYLRKVRQTVNFRDCFLMDLTVHPDTLETEMRRDFEYDRVVFGMMQHFFQ